MVGQIYIRQQKAKDKKRSKAAGQLFQLPDFLKPKPKPKRGKRKEK